MAKAKPNEISITRVYDAPVKAVWDAWVDPKKAAKWWGPRGFTITTHSKDLQPGGHWHYTMHGPDGTDWINKTKYFEVVRYSRLVYDHGGNDEQAPLFRVTVNFSEKDGHTTMEMIMAVATPEKAAEMKKFIKAAGGNSTWDRLGEFLFHEGEQRERFVINRSFEATVEQVFDMFVKPELLSRWLPPVGMTMEFLRENIKEGSTCFYRMKGEGTEMYGTIRYLEISRPHRLVYEQRFTDAQEKISRHPMVPVWPETMGTVITFVTEEDGGTRVTVDWEPKGKVSAAELKAFVELKPSMTQGWTGSFDKLEGMLAGE